MGKHATTSMLQDPCIVRGRLVMLQEGRREGLEGKNADIKGWKGGWSLWQMGER